jgi:hypothetical protein
MPRTEIEEFAELLIREVRDRSIASSDMRLEPDAGGPVARRWRGILGTGSSRDLVREVIPDCVDETIGNLLQAIDSGLLRISFLASNGNVVDLTDQGMGELAGWLGGDGWISKYSQKRHVNDFDDLKGFFSAESE